jgi:hypothetical protein
MKLGIMRQGWISLAGAMALCSCAETGPYQQITLKPGTSWKEVAGAGGTPTVRFSYLKDGRKYDLATLPQSPNPVLFENARLLAVLPPGTMEDFDSRIAEHLKTVELPFEQGVGGFHTWLLARPPAPPKPAEPTATTAGDVGEAAAAAVILAPIAPILLAGGVCGVAEHAMTGKDRATAADVNEALLTTGPSYESFLRKFRRHDFHTEKGTYQIREYLATDGAFFTGGDFFYEVGLRNGKPLWVTYRNDAVRFHAARYWSAHR